MKNLNLNFYLLIALTILCFFVLDGLHLNLEGLNHQNILILEKFKILETYANLL
jgi:hypothetical protein